MKNGETNTAIRDLHTLFEVGSVGGLSDGQVLDRFVARREEAVFEVIIHRHGPMVWGVCRRVLRDHHDAEDAFQATFLVLARKAASVKPREKVGNWLYGVAYQTAMKARSTRARRRVREGQVPDMPEPGEVREDLLEGLLALVDQELSRLPDKYRIPIILCELEGKLHREAAEQLGWPIGTVSGRLSRARAMLARRLSRRGVSLSGGSMAVLLAHDTASAGVTTQLIGSTARAASLFASGRAVTTGLVSVKVGALKEGVLKTMLLSKLKNISIIILASIFTGTGIISIGHALMSSRGAAAQEPTKQPNDGGQAERPRGSAPNPKEVPKVKSDMEQIQGVWRVERLEQVNHQPTEDEKAFWRSGGYTITIQGNKIKHNIDQSFILFTLDPSQAPKAMTLEVAEEGPKKGQHVPAIYRLDGDDLMICQGRLGDMEPPQAFSVENRRPGTFPTLYVLKRKQTITDAVQKVKGLEERVNALRTQLRGVEMELKQAQKEVGVSEDHPPK